MPGPESLESEGEQQRRPDPPEDFRRNRADEPPETGFRYGDDVVQVDGRVGLQSACAAMRPSNSPGTTGCVSYPVRSSAAN